MKFIAFGILLIVSCVQSATIVRHARNTEGIIPTIVEEILKVELQSDLKKNSDLEVAEETPAIKKIEVVPENVVVTEEKISAVSKDGTEQVVEFKKIETIEKPAEVVETFVPVAVRNVVKEQIPQVEELRNVPVIVQDTPAIQDIVPEPIAASVNVQPEVQVESKIRSEIPAVIVPEMVEKVEKIVEIETPKEEVKIVEVVIPTEVKKIVEDEPERPQAIDKIEEKVVVVETVVPEVKKVETIVPVKVEVDNVDPSAKQSDRPILQQIQNAVGQIFNRPAASPTVEDAVQDESTVTSTQGPIQAILGAAQNTFSQTVDRVQTVFNSFNNNAAAEPAADGETTTRQPLIAAIQNQAQNLQSSVVNTLSSNSLTRPIVEAFGIRPQSATEAPAAPANDVKEDVEMKPSSENNSAKKVPVVPAIVPPVVEKEVVAVEETKKEIVPPQEIVEEKKSEVVV